MKAKTLLAGVLVGLALAGCNDDGADADREAARLAEERRREALERRREAAGREVADATRAVEELLAKRDELLGKSKEVLALRASAAAIEAWASIRTSWADHLAGISSAFPPPADACLDTLKTSGTNTMALSVRAKSADVIGRIARDLIGAGYSVKVGPLSKVPPVATSPYLFGTDLTVVGSPTKAPGPPGAATSPEGDSPARPAAASRPASRPAVDDPELRRLGERIDELDGERRELHHNVARLETVVAARGDLVNRLGALSVRMPGPGASGHLKTAAKRSGLDQGGNFSLTPFGGKTVQGAYSTLGWTVQGRGNVTQVVDFLYLISRQTYLHRITGLTIGRIAKSRDLAVSLRYETLAPAIGKDIPLPAPPAAGAARLDAPERKKYNVVVSRNMFRPHVLKPTKPDKPTTRPKPAPDPVDPDLRVTSLMQVGPRLLISVRHDRTKVVKKYKQGDRLAGGVVVMVDYRTMPRPENRKKTSSCRLLLRMGKEYWAVELHDTLGNRWRMRADQVPKELSKRP